MRARYPLIQGSLVFVLMFLLPVATGLTINALMGPVPNERMNMLLEPHKPDIPPLPHA